MKTEKCKQFTYGVIIFILFLLYTIMYKVNHIKLNERVILMVYQWLALVA